MSKTYILILSVLLWFSGNVLAQQGQSGSPQAPEFDAKKAAGIVNYDIDKVTKKLKVEDQEVKNSITVAIYKFNIRMDEISMLNAETFRQLENDFDRNAQIAIQRRDMNQMNSVKTKIEETLPPIRDEVTQEQTTLNETMEQVLEEKQYNKWIKYQSSMRSSQSLN